MHAHLSLLLACAAAFAPPQTLYNLHKLPALFAETAEPDPALAAAIDAAVALCAKEGAPAAAEDRRLDFAGAADAETVRTNFAALAATVGDADAALRIVTNNKMVAGWKPDRVKASFDAWVERCARRGTRRSTSCRRTPASCFASRATSRTRPSARQR